MSDDEFEQIPNPGDNSKDSPFDFSGLNAETTEPITGFEPPHVRKPRWWESRPKSEKKTRQARVRKTRAAPVMPRGGLESALTQMYTGMGLAVMPFDPACGRVVIENAATCAESLNELAKIDPAVRRVLISLVSSSAWGAVIIAHAPILMAVAMHHVPALRNKQEKMVAEFAEMMANGFPPQSEGEPE